MTARVRVLPDRGAKADEDHQARLQREAAALRANLHRRKEQLRAKDTANPGAGKAKPGENDRS